MHKYDLDDYDVKDIVKSLTKNDLIKGPIYDHNNEKYKYPCWIFLKHIRHLKIMVYIKLKVINHKTKVLIYKIH